MELSYRFIAIFAIIVWGTRGGVYKGCGGLGVYKGCGSFVANRVIARVIDPYYKKVDRRSPVQ